MSRELSELSREEYEALKDCGMLWEFFPEATGNYKADLSHDEEERTKYFEAAQDDNVNKVVEKYLTRAAAGMEKYGVTTSDNPLELKEWLQHAQEEAMDFAVYLERVMEELRK